MAEKKTKSTAPVYYGTGRRKSSIARVYITPGTGKITVNGKDAKDFFPYDTNLVVLNEPFVTTNNVGKYDVKAVVTGGGFNGQTGAIRLGITRALLQVTNEYRPSLKVAGFITVDSRRKERKKYGLKAARRAPQFSKR
jgi:small subunit ribosomal protein S9